MTHYIDALRAAGTVGLGLAAGMAVGISTLSVPSMNNARQANERLHVWSKLYDLGKIQIPFLTLVSSLALGTAAHVASPATQLGFNRQTLLTAAVGVALSIVPFTFAVMMPGIHALKAIETKAFASKDAAGPQSDRLLAAWSAQHAVRAALLTAAFLIAVTELVMY